MIFLANGVTNLRTVAFFSTKRDEVETQQLADLSIDEDFCTCAIQCVPNLVVFAGENADDFYNNDKTSLLARSLNLVYPAGISASTTLATINNVNTGVKTPLVDVTHGDLIVVNRFYYFIVDWFKIKVALGLGQYKLEYTTTVDLYGQTLDYYCSPTYSLKNYSDKLANGTIRLEIEQTGKLNHSTDFTKMIDAGGKQVEYSNQIRLPGSLKFEAMNEETDHLTLNGSTRSSYQIKDQIRPTYVLAFHLVSSEQVVYTLFNDLFANPVKVSDYNVYNFVADVDNYSATKYRSIPLIKESSNFEATSKQKRKSFTFNMKYFNDKIFKTNS